MPKQISRSRYSPRYWPTWALVAGGWVLSRLPTDVLLATGRVLGRTLYRASALTDASRRHVTETNIALCFPDATPEERMRLARESFVHTTVGALETALAWLNPGRDVSARTHLEGLEHLQAAAAAGRGVLLVGGHFSALDIVAQRVSRAVDLDVMYRGNRNPVWEWLQVRGRRRCFGAVIERRDVRKALRRLAAGRILWYAPDQDYGPRHSVFAPFFGVPAATITATARLAEFNRSPVVFMSTARDPESGTWSARFSPALDDFPAGDKLLDAARINSLIESAVRVHPEQYLWMHRRFKTRPPGEAPVY